MNGVLDSQLAASSGGYSEEMVNQGLKETNIHENFTISGILFWIEEEWNKIEMQKIEWDLEKAEYKAVISSLQGERRGQENIKKDMILRIKMLEHALREERKINQSLSAKLEQAKAMGFAIDPLVGSAQLKTSDESDLQPTANQNGEKPIEESDKPLDVFQRVEKDAGRAREANSQWKTSVDRLKRYLIEIGYNETVMDMRQLRLHRMEESQHGRKNLDRMPMDHVIGSAGSVGNENVPESEEAVMENFSFLDDEETEDGAGLESGKNSVKSKNYRKIYNTSFLNDPTKSITRGTHKTSNLSEFMANLNAQDQIDAGSEHGNYHNTGGVDLVNLNAYPEALGDLASITVANDAEGSNYDYQMNAEHQMSRIPVAPGTPEEDEVFKHSQSLNAALGLTCGESAGGELSSDSSLAHTITTAAGSLNLVLRCSLQAHWDVIRTVSVHWDANMLGVLSGGDDCLAVLWSLQPSSTSWEDDQQQQQLGGGEASPVRFLRAAASPILCSALIEVVRGGGGGGGQIHDTVACVGCVDGALHVWNLAAHCWLHDERRGGEDDCDLDCRDQSESTEVTSASAEPANREPAAAGCHPPVRSVSRAHSDAAWSLAWDASCPMLAVEVGLGDPAKDQSDSWNGGLFASVSADAVVGLWSLAVDVEECEPPASQSACGYSPVLWRRFSLADSELLAASSRASCAVLLSRESFCYTCLVVGGTGGELLAFSLDEWSHQSEPATPRLMHRADVRALLECGESTTTTTTGRINSMASHPTRRDLLAVGLDSGHVLLWDVRMGCQLAVVVAHERSVSAVAFDPTGLYFATTSLDESLRVWQLSTRYCVQEMHAHRNKFHESALCLAFHARQPLLVSAGADSLVNVYDISRA